MTHRAYIHLLASAAMATAFAFPSSAIITSDENGTHTVQNGEDIVFANVDSLQDNAPDLDHDSVQRLFFDLPGNAGTFCSSALISTPQGPAVLLAAHCITDSQGQLNASNFEVSYPTAFGFPVTLATNDPNDVKIHPNYDGIGWHGYDLALV